MGNHQNKMGIEKIDRVEKIKSRTNAQSKREKHKCAEWQGEPYQE